MRLHDDLAGAVHIPAQVVVEHGGQAARLEQLPVVPVQVVLDECQARELPGVEGLDNGPVAAAVRIAGAPISWGVCEVAGWGHHLSPTAS